MKYSIYLILWEHNSNTKGLYPIYIKVTINRKPAYISTGYFIPKADWDSSKEQVKSSHPNARTINGDITKKKNKLSDKIVQLNFEGKTTTAKQLKAFVTLDKDLKNFFDFTDVFIEEVRNKRAEGTIENYEKVTAKLEELNGSRALSFEEMDNSFLAKFERSLRDAGMSDNYIHSLFKILKMFFTAAIKRSVTTSYPFSTYELTSYTPPVKDYLTLEEISKIEEAADNEPNKWHRQAAIYFLLGVYTGIRVSDWQKFDVDKVVKDNRVLLRATKNKEWVTMPITEGLRRNFKRMKKTPLTITEPTLNEKIKLVAKDKKIKKHITTHTARHTFAITLCAERGISCETCAELMGITVKTCIENYYKVTNRKIDAETLKAWKGL